MPTQAYLERVALTQPGVRRVCLIAKAGLLGMYASCGFALKGLSPVVHGKDPWFEMFVDFDSTEPRLLRFVQVRSVLCIRLVFIRVLEHSIHSSLEYCCPVS